MKIIKPDITIPDWEFSLPNGSDTVAFFDPTLKDSSITVVRKADADVIKASEKVIDAGIQVLDWMEHLEEDTGITSPPKGKLINALKESGCTIHNS